MGKSLFEGLRERYDANYGVLSMPQGNYRSPWSSIYTVDPAISVSGPRLSLARVTSRSLLLVNGGTLRVTFSQLNQLEYVSK